MNDFVIVEYLDEAGRPAGRYAKRYRDGDEEVEVGAVDEKTGIPVKLRVKVPKFRDEAIPKRCYIITGPGGEIVSVSEVSFSKAVEIEAAPHPFTLLQGHECHELPALPEPSPAALAARNGDRLSAIVDSHVFDRASKALKRKVPG